MPLGIKKVRKPNIKKKDMDSKKATYRLIQFEKNLLSDKMHKKRKRKRNKEIAVCDISSSDSSKNGNISDLNFDVDADTIDSKNKTIDATVIAKTNLQDTNAGIKPPKKRKKSILLCDEPSNKHEITGKNNEKLAIRTSKKINKVKEVKLNQTNDLHLIDKSVKHKTKKMAFYEWQMSDDINQHTFISPISENKISSKKTNNKSITEKIISENNVTCNDQKKLLKNELSNQIQKQINLNNSPEKKQKITFLQDTAQHMSKYLQQIHKTPTIPFNAKEELSATILKTNPMPNLFRTKKIKLRHTHDAHLIHKNVRHKKRKTKFCANMQLSDNINQGISRSLIIKNKSPSKKIDNKLEIKKKISKNNISQNDQKTLQDKLLNQINKKIDLKNPLIEKKKVVFGLSRNTAQHTSEYLQQVRESPAIPFDANKKPLVSVLKTSPIPSPFNPFYKKKNKVK